MCWSLRGVQLLARCLGKGQGFQSPPPELLLATRDQLHKEDTNQQAPTRSAQLCKVYLQLVALRKRFQEVCTAPPTLP